MSKVISGNDPIVYHKSEGADLQEKEKYTDWLISLGEVHSARIENLHYYFCSDEELLGMNKQFLNHDYYTDILTFPYGSNQEISGEIFISTDRVADNAASLKTTYEEELRRVMAHGLLHLLGYDDHSEEEVWEMRKLEDAALDMFHVKH
ncbi:rRNA maturation RNase YbeY [Robiginitalea myxolifaciens]|uniref:Endoribonuclease YbeY n=1 Tax=Robiginitalea myxolifaciens TaxID=400055 RepID=A0A1I6G334_9FLAO|nr:rRNA maturation RNase YbeY [Robiginitalea myxolifaciens]SFR36582.1 rRNA maturation RNase YbeY [Robiginitalea myxolifaciens]